MSQNIRQKSRLTLMAKRMLVACTALVCFSSIFWVKVYTGKEKYDWKAHARVEPKTPPHAGSTSKKFYQSKPSTKIDVALKKLSPQQLEQAEKILELQESIKDYQEKLQLHASDTQNLELNRKLQSLEAAVEKLKKQYPQP